MAEKNQSGDKLFIFYRISDGGYDKNKPGYISNAKCLENFTTHFSTERMTLIADNVKDETWDWLNRDYSSISKERTDFGNGAQSFNRSLDLALKNGDEAIIYFVEDDYIHRAGAQKILLNGFTLSVDYVTLYDHPDKYMDPGKGGNPFVKSGGEETKILLTDFCHWKVTNSTTMTFAARVKTLKKDERVLRKFTDGTYPFDYKMFLKLRKKGRILVSSIPGFATHGEIEWLAPLTDWSQE